MPARLACLAFLLLVLPGSAEARFDWRQMLSCLGRGATRGVTQEGQPAKIRGQYRPSDDSVWVWRGPVKLRTLVHELLHRATVNRPRTYAQDLRDLTGTLDVDEGLTSYFADRALDRARLQPGFPEPAPGARFATRRAWAVGLRRQARNAIAEAFDLEVSTANVHVLSDASFGRGLARRSMNIWVRPGDEVSYPEQQEIARELVRLAGETPVRHAYFTGDLGPLREALRQAKARAPGRSFPSWIELEPGR